MTKLAKTPVLALACLCAAIFSASRATAAGPLDDIDGLISAHLYSDALPLIENGLSATGASEALLYRQVLCLFRAGKLRQSSNLVGNLLKRNRHERAYLNLAGAISLKQTDYPQAIQCFYASLKTCPDDPDVWVNFNYAMRRSLYVATPQKYVSQLTIDFPRNIGAKLVLAEVAFANGRSKPFLDLIEETGAQALPDVFLQRLSLFARQWADPELDLKILRRRLSAHPNDSGIKERIAGLESVLRLAAKSRIALSSIPKGPVKTPASQAGELPMLSTEPIMANAPIETPEDEAFFRFPFPAGEAKFCAQASDGAYSHTGRAQHGCDFYLRPGSLVLAGRSGLVVEASEELDPSAVEDFGPTVVIAHSDGTCSRYFHLAENGVKVRVGQRVKRGQLIGMAGVTAVTKYPILHFEVARRAFWGPMELEPYRSWRTVPVSFQDLTALGEESGAPIEGRWYVSANILK